MVVAVEEAEPEGFGRVVHSLAELFYADGRLLVPPWPACLQFGRSERAVQPGQIEYQCGENGGDDLPAMFIGRPTRVGGVQLADDRRRSVVPVLLKGKGMLPGLLHRLGIWVNGGVPSVPERYCPGATVGENPASGRPPNLSGILP